MKLFLGLALVVVVTSALGRSPFGCESRSATLSGNQRAGPEFTPLVKSASVGP